MQKLRVWHALAMLACGLSAFVASAATPEMPATGLIAADPAQYAALPKRPRTRGIVLVDKIDLSPYFPPPGHQRTQASCSAWAVGYGVRSYYYGAQRGEHPSSPALMISPSSIFNYTTTSARGRPPECGGVDFPDTLDFLRTQGASTLAEMPYDAQTCRPSAAQPAPVEKPELRVPQYSTFPANELRDPRRYREVLAKGHPVIVAMQILMDEYWPYKAGEIYRSQRIGTGPHDAHGMVVIGFDDTTRAFLLYNSWGADWGDHGKMWIDYDTFFRQVREAYVIEGLAPAYQPTAIPAPSPLIASETPAERLGKLAGAVRCGSVTVGADQGAPSLSGFLDADEADALRAAALAINPDVKLTLTDMSWPACEAGAVLASRIKPEALRVTARRADGADTRGHFAEGDSFTVTIEAPAETPFVQVYYLQADRTAKELYRGEVPLTASGARVLRLGAGALVNLKISQPFGPEAIFAFAGKQMLPLGDAGFNVGEHAFVDRLRAAFKAAPDIVQVAAIAPVQALAAPARADRWLITPHERVSFDQNAGADASLPPAVSFSQAGGPSFGDAAVTINAGRVRFTVNAAAGAAPIDAASLKVLLRVSNGWIDITDRVAEAGRVDARGVDSGEIRMPPGSYRVRTVARDQTGRIAARDLSITTR